MTLNAAVALWVTVRGTGGSLQIFRDRKDLCEESHKAKVVGAVSPWELQLHS